MFPVKFDEANRQLLKPATMSDEECKPLWVYTNGEQCISRWKMSFWECVKAWWFGGVWLQLYSGGTQPPVCLSADKTVFYRPSDN